MTADLKDLLAQSLAAADRRHAEERESRDTIRDSIEASNICLASLDWRLAKLCDYALHHQETLQQILEALQNPHATEANEFKEQGERADRNQWFDEAINDFEQALKLNYQDFTVHLSLGNLYLENKHDPDKARTCYGSALKYAKPYSPDYAATAYVHISRAERSLGNPEGAFNATAEALKLAPSRPDVHYEHAINLSHRNRKAEALQQLKIAINGGSLFSVSALEEPGLESMRPGVLRLIANLRDKERHRAEEWLQSLGAILDDVAIRAEQSHLKQEGLQELYDSLYVERPPSAAPPAREATATPGRDSRDGGNTPRIIADARRRISELKEKCRSKSYLRTRRAGDHARGLWANVRERLEASLRADQMVCEEAVRSLQCRIKENEAQLRAKKGKTWALGCAGAFLGLVVLVLCFDVLLGVIMGIHFSNTVENLIAGTLVAAMFGVCVIVSTGVGRYLKSRAALKEGEFKTRIGALDAEIAEIRNLQEQMAKWFPPASTHQGNA